MKITSAPMTTSSFCFAQESLPNIATSSIFLLGLCVEAIMGVYPQERQQKQRLLIDLKLEVDFVHAARTDELSNAVDYASVRQTTIDFIQANACQLLETLVVRLQDHLFCTYPLAKSLELQISKPDIFGDVKGIGVILKSQRP